MPPIYDLNTGSISMDAERDFRTDALRRLYRLWQEDWEAEGLPTGDELERLACDLTPDLTVLGDIRWGGDGGFDFYFRHVGSALEGIYDGRAGAWLSEHEDPRVRIRVEAVLAAVAKAGTVTRMVINRDAVEGDRTFALECGVFPVSENGETTTRLISVWGWLEGME